jgi:hypothetical protein
MSSPVILERTEGEQTLIPSFLLLDRRRSITRGLSRYLITTTLEMCRPPKTTSPFPESVNWLHRGVAPQELREIRTGEGSFAIRLQDPMLVRVSKRTNEM